MKSTKNKNDYYTDMIKVEKDKATEVAVTFAENTTVDPLYYLIEVTNTDDEVLQSITPTDLSDAKERYNLFSITSSLPAGEYSYAAYQSSTPSPTIDDVIGDPIEYGIFVVISNEDLEDSIYI